MGVTRLGPMGLPFPGGAAAGAKDPFVGLKKQECVGSKGKLIRSSAFKRISSFILTILGA